MLPLNIPWRLIGAVGLVAAVSFAGWRVNTWHTSHGLLRGALERLELEESCADGSKCAARVAAAEVAQAARNQEAVAGYEKEIADLRNRPVPTRVIRVCRQGSQGDLRDATRPQGTPTGPGTGLVHEPDEFDTAPLRELARQADEVAAAYRALRSRDEALAAD